MTGVCNELMVSSIRHLGFLKRIYRSEKCLECSSESYTTCYLLENTEIWVSAYEEILSCHSCESHADPGLFTCSREGTPGLLERPWQTTVFCQSIVRPPFYPVTWEWGRGVVSVASKAGFTLGATTELVRRVSNAWAAHDAHNCSHSFNARLMIQLPSVHQKEWI